MNVFCIILFFIFATYIILSIFTCKYELCEDVVIDLSVDVQMVRVVSNRKILVLEYQVSRESFVRLKSIKFAFKANIIAMAKNTNRLKLP